MLIDQAAEMGMAEVVNARGQITNQEGLNQALFALMEERYQGGMALQAKTFSGMLSNAKDAMATMARTVSAPIFDRLKEGLSSVVPIMSAATAAIQGDWVGVQQTLNDSFGPEVALKIENVFLAVSAGVHRAKEFIADLQPTVDNLISIFNNLKPILADVGLAIGGAFVGLMEVLPPILEQITAIVEAVTSWEGFIPTISGVVAAVGSYKGIMELLTAAQALYDKVVAVGTLIQGAWTAAMAASAAAGGGLRGVVAGLRAAMVALNFSMLANPFVLVAALIIGLGVAFVQAYRHSETFRDIVNQAWASLKEGFAATIDWFTTTLPAWVASVVEWFINLKDRVVGKVGELTASALGAWNNFKSGTMAVITTFIEAAVGYFGALRDRIMAIIQPFITFFVQSWENLKLLVLAIVTGLASLLTGDIEGMRLAVIGIVTALKNQALAIWQLFKDTTLKIILGLADGIKNGFISAKNWVISTVTNIKNQAVSDFNDLKTRAVNAAVALKDGVINGFNSLKTGAINAVIQTKNNIVNGFNEAKNTAVSAAVNLYNGVVKWLQSVPGKVTEMKNNMVSTIGNIDLYQMGKDAIQGFINGIGSMITAVKTKVGSVVEALKTKLAEKLQLGSPSKLLKQYGEWSFEGFVNGADSMISDIRDVAGRAADAILPNNGQLDLGMNANGKDMSFIGSKFNNALGPESNNYARMFEGAVFNVRSDDDIEKLARELGSYIKRNGRKSGVVY